MLKQRERLGSNLNQEWRRVACKRRDCGKHHSLVTVSSTQQARLTYSGDAKNDTENVLHWSVHHEHNLINKAPAHINTVTICRQRPEGSVVDGLDVRVEGCHVCSDSSTNTMAVQRNLLLRHTACQQQINHSASCSIKQGQISALTIISETRCR
jgi:hypothetical protein